MVSEFPKFLHSKLHEESCPTAKPGRLYVCDCRFRIGPFCRRLVPSSARYCARYCAWTITSYSEKLVRDVVAVVLYVSTVSGVWSGESWSSEYKSNLVPSVSDRFVWTCSTSIDDRHIEGTVDIFYVQVLVNATSSTTSNPVRSQWIPNLPSIRASIASILLVQRVDDEAIV